MGPGGRDLSFTLEHSLTPSDDAPGLLVGPPQVCRISERCLRQTSQRSHYKTYDESRQPALTEACHVHSDRATCTVDVHMYAYMYEYKASRQASCMVRNHTVQAPVLVPCPPPPRRPSHLPTHAYIPSLLATQTRPSGVREEPTADESPRRSPRRLPRYNSNRFSPPSRCFRARNPPLSSSTPSSSPTDWRPFCAEQMDLERLKIS